MGIYIVERYLAGWSPEQVAELVNRIDRAADRFGDFHVVHIDSITIPGDEMCLCLFEAAGLENVRIANLRLGFPVDRVVAAQHRTVHP